MTNLEMYKRATIGRYLPKGHKVFRVGRNATARYLRTLRKGGKPGRVVASQYKNNPEAIVPYVLGNIVVPIPGIPAGSASALTYLLLKNAIKGAPGARKFSRSLLAGGAGLGAATAGGMYGYKRWTKDDPWYTKVWNKVKPEAVVEKVENTVAGIEGPLTIT